MTSFGPMVHRSARFGGLLFLLGSLQFVIAMIVVQAMYPAYTDFGNYVSDLGSSHSPWAWLFNDAIRLLGVLGFLGTLFIRSAIPARLSGRVGLGFLLIASIGAFLVGSFPEGSPELGGNVHSVVSAVTFIGSGLGLLALGPAMLRDTRWEGFRGYTFLSGIVTLVALVLFFAGAYPGLGPGGMERIIIAPILLWAIVAGAHLLRLQPYSGVRLASPT
ncbi:MAG: DUF998 domain-containing protein [Thermoplasmata archaeon]|nr:DUF998 domain-containing protein [Thermoplasmata archaeon]